MAVLHEADVRRVFRDLLNLEEPVDWSAVRYQATPEWDSLVHMAIVTRLESAIGEPLADDEILGIDDYASAVRLLRARGVLAAGSDDDDARAVVTR